MLDQILSLPGVDRSWGVFAVDDPSCPDAQQDLRRVAVVGTGPAGVLRALALRAHSPAVALLTNGDGGLRRRQRVDLAHHGIGLDERAIAGLTGQDGRLLTVVFADGEELEVTALLVGAGSVPAPAIP